MNFLEITPHSVDRLELFVRSIGSSADTFRYYSKRIPSKAIANHLVTVLLIDEETVGYGHLDLEDGIVWLGICVKDSCVGKGYGSIIMDKLVSSHDGDIMLTVDSDNAAAIALYKKFGFKVIKEGSMLSMERSSDTSI